jgi:hypothetical protein
MLGHVQKKSDGRKPPGAKDNGRSGRMSRRERDKLQARIEGIGFGQGGLLDAEIAKTLVKSILLLDESNELSFKVNCALTVVLLLVGLFQVWIMVSGPGSSQPAQRFMLSGDEHAMAIDSKTGLSCYTPPFNGKEASYERLVRNTPTVVEHGFLPFCTDIYQNERRVLKDFDNYMQQEPRETKK